jgi:hypothetical protein
MIRARCDKCGLSYPAAEPHQCDPKPEPHNDNPPPPENDNPPPPGAAHFDEKAWRKAYMKKYMRRKRERERREKQTKQHEGIAS